jgi:uncharacterized protein (TIGR01777 family)
VKIVIPGGSGQVGTILARSFRQTGDEVVVLSRSPQAVPWRVVPWDGKTVGEWAAEIDGADVVINLAGRSVNCRYTAKNRAEILNSRVDSTLAVGAAIAASSRPPRIWLQASTATIYSHRYDASNDERCGAIGGRESNAPDSWRFSIEVARKWEAAARVVELPSTRQVLLRSAVVMSPDPGGIFSIFRGLVRLGLGGRVGGGSQFMSWIHHEDFVRALRWLIEHDEMAGVVNVAAPAPVPQAEFMRTLRHAAGMPFGLPATSWMMDLAAFVYGTESELMLKSRRVVPTRLVEGGFTFNFPTWPEAAADLVRRPQVAASFAR